ncbi:MAG: hypothetical protein J6U64_04815 [Alphaproteobacteria bacterium]|nr:hypothetical protein [Alphaproteobacteria bacterium]
MNLFQKGKALAEIFFILFLTTLMSAGIFQAVSYALDMYTSKQIYESQALRYARISTSATFQKTPIGTLVFKKTFENVPKNVSYQHLKMAKDTLAINLIPVSDRICKSLLLKDYPNALIGIFVNGEEFKKKNTNLCVGNNNHIRFLYHITPSRYNIYASEEETETTEEIIDDSCKPACNKDLCFECLDGMCQYMCSSCESCNGEGRCISSCTGDYTCYEGKCVECLTNLHCPVGKECIENICDPCIQGSPCASCPKDKPVWRNARCVEA